MPYSRRENVRHAILLFCGFKSDALQESPSRRRKDTDMKIRIFAVALAMAFGATCRLAADTETIGGYTWTYRITDDTAEIYNNNVIAVSPSLTGAVTIPETLGGKPVTSIGWSAFNYCRGLTSVTIPNSVTNIGIVCFAVVPA